MDSKMFNRFISLFSSIHLWWNRFVDQLDMKIAIKTAVAAILSLFLSDFLSVMIHRPSYLVSNLWSVITAIVVLQTSIGGTYKAVWFRFIGVLIGSVVGALFAFEFGADPTSIGLAILSTMIVCGLCKIPDSYRLAALSVAVIMLPWKNNPELNPAIYALYRFFDTCLGFITALVVAHTLWPSRALDQIRVNISERFDLFSQFVIFLFPQKLDTSAVLQKVNENIEESFNQNQVILEETKVELLPHAHSFDRWINLTRCQEQLWENLLILESISYANIEKIFDESLSRQIAETLSFIHLVLKEAALALKNGEDLNNFHLIESKQNALTEELVRFRETHRMRALQLDVVEDCFVFFYQLRKILIILSKFEPLLKN